MKSKILKIASLIVALTCILCCPVKASATAQGTNGTEMEVVQPQKLEIQLGKAWSGVEFQLKTDVGIYPDAVPVGEDGVLRLEIGGSSSYILTCLTSSAAVPEPEDAVPVLNTQSTEVTEETKPQTSAAAETTEFTAAETESTGERDAQSSMIGGIPVTQVIIFAMGLLLAITLLVIMQKNQKNHESEDSEEEE